MLAGNSGIAKSAACNEVNGDVELPLSSIEVNTSDIPRRAWFKSCRFWVTRTSRFPPRMRVAFR
jgi:hypothetical protein